jgi:hypothetical protein
VKWYRRSRRCCLFRSTQRSVVLGVSSVCRSSALVSLTSRPVERLWTDDRRWGLIASRFVMIARSRWSVDSVPSVRDLKSTHLSELCVDDIFRWMFAPLLIIDVPSRIPIARSCIESPRRSFANRVVATASELVRMSCTSVLISLA